MYFNHLVPEELEPVDGRKSFYHKAIMYTDTLDGTVYLKSYETIVAAITDGKLYRCWDGWSATTGRHVNAFAIRNGLGPCGKSLWDKLPRSADLLKGV